MYLPPHFTVSDESLAWQMVRDYPFASLISNDNAGLPFVSHLPLHLEQTGLQPVLMGHCARPNPHWLYLQARPLAVVTFMGPHAYMTPRVYTDLIRVPTWSYVTVHCTVEARLVETFDDKDRVLKHLIADHDPAYAEQWQALPDDYQQQMMRGIVAFELHVKDWQCKVKLNQHRPEAHAAMQSHYAAGNENEQALAQWMERLGMKGN